MTKAERDDLLTRRFSGVRPWFCITEFCFGLRNSVDGSAEPISKEQEQQDLSYLRLVLETWVPSTPHQERLDNAVKELVSATIEEVETYIQCREQVLQDWKEIQNL